MATEPCGWCGFGGTGASFVGWLLCEPPSRLILLSVPLGGAGVFMCGAFPYCRLGLLSCMWHLAFVIRFKVIVFGIM